MSQHGPYQYPPSAYLDEDARRQLLDDALAGVELGSFDQAVIGWLVAAETPRVRSVAGMIERVRLLERKAGRLAGRLAGRKPLRGAELDSFLLLLEAIRDALTAGHPDLAAMILEVLLEHRGELGLRSRRYADLLREAITERQVLPDPDQPPPPGAT